MPSGSLFASQGCTGFGIHKEAGAISSSLKATIVIYVSQETGTLRWKLVSRRVDGPHSQEWLCKAAKKKKKQQWELPCSSQSGLGSSVGMTLTDDSDLSKEVAPLVSPGHQILADSARGMAHLRTEPPASITSLTIAEAKRASTLRKDLRQCCSVPLK